MKTTKRVQKFLACLVSLTLTLALPVEVKAGFTASDKQEIVFDNLLGAKNAGFENGTVSWTAPSGTLTNITTPVFAGGAAGSWDSASAGQVLISAAIQTGGRTRANAEAACRIQAASGTPTHKLQAYNVTTSTVLAETTISTSSTAYVRNAVNFNFPATSTDTIALRVVSVASNEPAIYIDDCYLGAATNFAPVSQATYIGGISYASTASCDWSTTSNVMGSFAAVAACPTPTTYGAASAPATKIPAAVFNNLAPGQYRAIIKASADRAITANGFMLQMWDGSTALATQYYGLYNTYVLVPTILEASFELTAPGSKTIELRGRVESSGTLTIPNSSAVTQKFEVHLYRFPSASETAYRPDRTLDTIGQVFYVASSTCPQGSLLADGSLVSRSAYAQLFNRISTTFGAGDGSTTFAIPDARGIFIRGSGSQTYGSETYSGTLGTKQNDATAKNGLALSDPGHTHSTRTDTVGNINNDGLSGGYRGWTPGLAFQAAGMIQSTTTGITLGNGDTETRPANIALTPCISYVAAQAPLLVGGVVAPDNTTGVTRINTVKTVSTAYTATEQDETIIGTAALTLSLPPVATVVGKKYHIQASGSSANILIDPSGAESICTQSSLRVMGDGDTLTIQSNGTKWVPVDDSKCWRTDSAFIAGCSSVVSQSGWISSVTSLATGRCQINIPSPYSARPNCSCNVSTSSGSGLGGRLCEISANNSASALEVWTGVSSTQVATTYNFDIVCHGPR